MTGGGLGEIREFALNPDEVKMALEELLCLSIERGGRQSGLIGRVHVMKNPFLLLRRGR